MADAWTSVVETEPEWDETTRTLVEGLDQYDRDVHACGLHSSILADPENNKFRLEEDHCEMCASIARRGRVMAEADAAWEKTNPGAEPKVPRPKDGRSLVLRPMTPAEIEKAEQAKQERAKEVARGRRPAGKRPR